MNNLPNGHIIGDNDDRCQSTKTDFTYFSTIPDTKIFIRFLS
ncbi:hypothetical protein [Dyadobacter diqingensis]|nr:hypothetical protein [Dyadobacter diqingensis]